MVLPAPDILAIVVPAINTNFSYVTAVYKESKYLERLLLTRSDFFDTFGASLGQNRDRVEILKPWKTGFAGVTAPVIVAEPKTTARGKLPVTG